jgi:hypothetical protein
LLEVEMPDQLGYDKLQLHHRYAATKTYTIHIRSNADTWAGIVYSQSRGPSEKINAASFESLLY